MRYLKLYLVSLLALFFIACSDDDDDSDFLFDREISDYSVIRECSSDDPESTSCYKIRYRYPILMDNYSGLCVWIDTTVVDSATLSVNEKQVEAAHNGLENAFFRKYEKTSSYYDTLDLTDIAVKYMDKNYEKLQVVMYCEYTDGGNAGAVQRLFLQFKDHEPPSLVEPLRDSVWSTGAMFEWLRPTDQTDYYKPGELSGKIVGYNLRLWAEDPDEDIRNLKVTVITPDGTDDKGNRFYKRHARIRRYKDSTRVDTVDHGDKRKNFLNFVVFDGNGYDSENMSKNRYRVFVEGLRTRSNTKKYSYTIAISSWDEAGNYSGSEVDMAYDACHEVYTTDSIAPIMPKKVFTIEDSLFPGYAKLDENNRLRIFWSRSLDPLKFDHGIVSDSEIIVPKGCNEHDCYESVSRYVVEYYNKLDKSWHEYSYAGGDRYSVRYMKNDNDGFDVDLTGQGTFVTDTIRWVAPGDTLVLRIRSEDDSKYYSAALVDTVFVSPGALSKELECPEGFVAVSTSDTTSFCIERFEHRDESGKFMTNVLHSEAQATCEAISASGFDVSLCGERDWELVCLSGGSLPYGFIEEESAVVSSHWSNYCNVSTNDSISAADVSKRDQRCMNPMGVRDLPGQYQEWVMGRSDDTTAVLKGASYKVYEGLDHESIAYCTNRAFPFYTRLDYTQDSVYLYREGTKVDTVYVADTTRTLYEVLTKKDFKDTLQFYDVIDANGKVIGTDYSLYSEYKKGGQSWLDSLSNGLNYKPSKKEAVFLTGKMVNYRQASAFYKSSSIGFRCCAYKK